MYVFRLAPVSVDRVNDWVDWDAISFASISDPDDVLAPEWSPSGTYQVGEYASRNQYAFISLKNNSTDDPIYNYIGRTPDPWKDSVFGYGQNSWLKSRLLSKYLCFNTIQPGYTWSSNGTIDVTIKPTKTMQDSSFFGDGVVASPTYLILSDLVGGAVTVSIMDSSSVVLSTETITLDHSMAMVPDWFFNPELPGISRNTIIRPFDISTGAYKVRVQITPPSDDIPTKRAGIGGFYFGRATKVGQTKQSDISFSFNDLSKLTEDDWGHVSLSKGRVAKKIDASVFVETSKADAVFKILQHVRSTPTFFFFSNNLEGAIVPGTIISNLTSIMGLVTQSSQGRENARKTEMSLTIEAIPTSFTDVLITDPESICGMPSLPVVPVVDTTPTNPETPPPSAVAVTGVTISRTTLTAYTNKTYYLYATVAPSNAGNKAVTWSSSDVTKATVSSTGAVTGKAVGSCTITVTTVNGGFTASCIVTVKLPVAPPTPPTPYDPNILQFYIPFEEDNNTLQFVHPME